MPVSKIADNEAVNSYMLKLKHPLKDEIESVRKIIMSSDNRIKERIKWNAPSYYCIEDMVTFNLRNQMSVHIVFHHPEIVKIKSPLLLGDYKDRRTTYFKNMKEIRSNKKALQSIIKELVNRIYKKPKIQNEKTKITGTNYN